MNRMVYPLTTEKVEMILRCSQCGVKIKIVTKPNKDKTDYDIELKPLEFKTCRACRTVTYEATKKLKKLLRRIDKRAYEELHIFINDVARTKKENEKMIVV